MVVRGNGRPPQSIFFVRAGSGPASAPPVFVLGGGPGGSAIDQSFAVFSAFVAAGRSAVAFDYRGTGRSTPSLDCPETGGLVQARPAAFADAVRRCRARLDDLGIDLADYNNLENAADFNALRGLLGYSRVDIYADSEGTRAAFAVMARYPRSLRRVVLAAPAPPGEHIISDAAANFETSLAAMVKACDSAPGCATRYPNLSRRWMSFVTRGPRTPGDAVADSPRGTEAASVIQAQLASAESLPFVPATMDAIIRGDFDAGTVGPTSLTPAISGVYLTTRCSEDLTSSVDNSALPLIGDWTPVTIHRTICGAWGIRPTSSFDRISLAGNHTRTLMLTGEYDPIHPPAYAEQAHRLLVDSTLTLFRSLSHDLDASPCAMSLARDFLASGSTALQCNRKQGVAFMDLVGDRL